MQRLVVSLAVFAALGLAQTPGVTVRGEPVGPPPVGRRATTDRAWPPPAAPPYCPAGLPPDTGWTLIDSLVLHRLIPAGERLAVIFDEESGSLGDTLLPEYLTELGREAVAAAPDWLKDDLTDNLRRMPAPDQDRFGDLIVNCPDKRYYDELCFQVAHLSPGALSALDAGLLVDNVQLMYQIDPLLQYVDIVDSGDALQGGDYWSTTRYRTLEGEDTVWVAAPRDVYYWWVVSPKITDEAPEYVYDYFWREYLFYHADSSYPLLAEKLAATRLFWNGLPQSWPNPGQPFEDTLPAVAVIGRWTNHTVPNGASGNRPIQPNQIAHEHNGNCGELQDLMCAAARTALLPCGGVLDINEDHVWCELWWFGRDVPYAIDPTTYIDNPYVAYDRKYGGGKECSAIWDWRNDGLQRSVTGTYSDACTLTVDVREADGRPVDGAVVRLQSEGWQTTELYNCFFGVTDRTGRYTTVLGDWQNYYLGISSDLGSFSAGRIIDSADCAPGTRFFYSCTLAGRRDSLVVLPDSGTPRDEYRIDVTYAVGHQTVYGYDCWNAGGANYYALASDGGTVDFFFVDAAGFEDYLAGEAFAAQAVDEDSPGAAHSRVLVRPGNHHLLFSNEEQQNVSVFVDVTTRLYRRGVGLAGRPAAAPGDGLAIAIGPNPFSSRLSIRPSGAFRGDAAVRILDPGGRVVATLPAGSAATGWCWDGRDGAGRAAGAGVYFCEVTAGGRRAVRPVVYLGAGK